MATAHVTKGKNGSDYTVKVWREGIAPQIFNNLPVVDCLERIGCTKEEIEKCVVTKEQL